MKLRVGFGEGVADVDELYYTGGRGNIWMLGGVLSNRAGVGASQLVGCFFRGGVRHQVQPLAAIITMISNIFSGGSKLQ